MDAMDTSTVDVDGYLDRIGHPCVPGPTADVLASLVAAHVRHIPFENLDPLTGIPVANLDPESLQDKLVRRRRGGFCYEHNGLFRAVLCALGFRVDQLAGRVVWMKGPGPLPAETHQLLAVTVPDDGSRHLVDVGFGGQTPTTPLRFTIGDEQPTDLEPFRVGVWPEADLHVLESRVAGRWQPLYLFDERPRAAVDGVVGSWFASTHPDSHFRATVSACLVVDDARWNLRNRLLSIHRADGTSTKRELASEREILDVLAHDFGIDVDTVDRLEARVREVISD
ncbi:arylamine N-acetyltransferase [Gordonia sp. NPDC062954]|jgi:arylamine N-acetyltransferase